MVPTFNINIGIKELHVCMSILVLVKYWYLVGISGPRLHTISLTWASTNITQDENVVN